MRPILFTIPPLPASWLPFLLGAVALAVLAIGGIGGVRARRATGSAENSGDVLTSWLGGAAFAGAIVAALLWAWSRHDVQLHSYGLFLVFGFFVAAWVSCLEARRRGYDPNIVLDLALPLLFVCILFCRMVYVVLNIQQFHSVLDVISVWDGGLSFHGIFLGAPLVVWYFARSRGVRFGALCDIIAPSVFLGYVFGRIGCFMNGCCYGYACALPWAVRFPDEHNRSVLTLPSHPTQLYSAGLALLLFFVMQRARLMPRFNRFPGQITLLFFALYAVERFFIEIFRNGATASPIFGLPWLTTAQFVSILALAAIAIAWRVLLVRAETGHKAPVAKPETPKVSV